MPGEKEATVGALRAAAAEAFAPNWPPEQLLLVKLNGSEAVLLSDDTQACGARQVDVSVVGFPRVFFV